MHRLATRLPGEIPYQDGFIRPTASQPSVRVQHQVPYVSAFHFQSMFQGAIHFTVFDFNTRNVTVNTPALGRFLASAQQVSEHVTERWIRRGKIIRPEQDA